MGAAGNVTDKDNRMTGKAWIPSNFGSDRHRIERVCKGQGRLIFGGPAAFSYGSGNLVWVIHSANELGYH